ncbi:MAG: hypothetical protein PVJ39_14485 [Gammaproteobacteria bacterium]|jgi:hypothetical protein
MALRLLGSLNRIINRTTSDILDDQVINKVTGVVTTFLNSGVEAIRDLTAEEEKTESEGETESEETTGGE